MVKHGDNNKNNFQPLVYATRPHSEYRTVFHVIVQVIQPRLNQDVQTWQLAADIWNHIFAADLQHQNVRPQGGKHWRDQYVHRGAKSRPKEWQDICKPDALQPAAEMQRRAGYRQQVLTAAAALGIPVPAPDPAWTPPTAPTSKPAVSRSNTATAPAQPQDDDEDEDSIDVAKPTLTGPITNSASERTGGLDKSDGNAGKKPATQGKGWYYDETESNNDEVAMDTFEERYANSLPPPGSRRGTNSKLNVQANLTSGSSAAPQQPMLKSGFVPPNTYESGPATLNDEELAHRLQAEENRTKRTTRDGSMTNYVSHLESDDEEEEEELPARQVRPRKAIRTDVNEAGSAGLSGAMKRKVSIDDQLTGTQPSKGGRRDIKAPPVFTKSKDWERKNPNKIPHPRARGSALRHPLSRAINADEDMESGLQAESSRDRADTLPADKVAPTPLPVIHGGFNTTMWIDGKPHANSPMPREDGTRDPAILRASSMVSARGGLVLSGRLDGKWQDVMVCVAGECGWCDPTANNSTMGSTVRPSIGKPIVHACCVEKDEVEGILKFRPADGIGHEWQEGVPNVVNSEKVQFRDGKTREVVVCVPDKCAVCKKVMRGTKKKM